jgi:mRNA-degrading endonuclease toxin of MazEF toxin-antitoxin module
LDPVKGAEVGKRRPVVTLTDQTLLDIKPAHVFICPLSSSSDKSYQALHVKLSARDNLHVESYALAEHCRSISIRRLQPERLAQLDPEEVTRIIHKLQRLIGV